MKRKILNFRYQETAAASPGPDPASFSASGSPGKDAGEREDLRGRNANSIGDPFHRPAREVDLPPLHAGDMGEVNLASVRDLLLAQARAFPQGFDGLSDGEKGVF